MRFESIMDAIGRTPLVRLNKAARGVKPKVYVKMEFVSPGGSVKDRIGIAMIEGAEKRGELKPGGTIIEGTSGNTGVGLAIAAAYKGYKVIFTIQDKQSREKINMLKALGAEVIICPTAVAPEDPRSYYAVAKKLSKEVPGAYFPNQYDNPDNPLAHERTTGPEIWDDTEGKVTHFVAGMGTGGTISGTAKYLKKMNPRVKIVGVDPIGSILYDFFKTGKIVEPHEYKVEGIGEDMIPRALDFALLDDIIQVTDKESFLWARRLAREEGVFVGGSSGTAMSGAMKLAKNLGANDLIVVLLPDGGNRALSKLYNDEWMKENRFMEADIPVMAQDIVGWKGRVKKLIFAEPQHTLIESLKTMQELEISQLPVMEAGKPIGALYEDDILRLVMNGSDLSKTIVREAMSAPFPIVAKTASLDDISGIIPSQAPAIFVDIGDGKYEILTKYDLVHSISKIMEKKI